MSSAPSAFRRSLAQARLSGRTALAPIIMAGVPSVAGTSVLARAVEEGGADAVVLVQPTRRAADAFNLVASLEAAEHVTPSALLDIVSEVRRTTAIPILLAVDAADLNAELADDFAERAERLKVDALLVFGPAKLLTEAASAHGVETLPLLRAVDGSSLEKPAPIVVCVGDQGRVLRAATELREASPSTRVAFALPGLETSEDLAKIAPHADVVMVSAGIASRMLSAGSVLAAARALDTYTYALSASTPRS